MLRDRGGRRPNVETTDARLWVWPTVAAVGAAVLALVLTEVRPIASSAEGDLAWPGDAAAALALLQTTATAAMTTLTMAFSVTMVALVLASQQFSPRLLRDFVRDRVTKAVVAVLVATVVFPLVVIRRIDEAEPVPAAAMALAMLLGLASVVAVVGFVGHLTRVLRVDSMMRMVHEEAARAIVLFYPSRDDDRPRSPDEVQLPDSPGRVDAARGGFVRSVSVPRLVVAAEAHGCLVGLEARPGDHVASGTPLATVWRLDDSHEPVPWEGPVPEELVGATRAAVVMGYERTIEQDVAFGFRQLADIAVKALSPGINDPVTAAHAVGHMAELLVQLTARRLGPTLHLGDDGVGRAIVPDRDLRYYLDLACGQVRRFGAHEPTVLAALLRLCRDVAVHVEEPADRDEVERQVQLVMSTTDASLEGPDRASVDDLAARARLALDGRVLEAYRDRSGATRSI